MIDYGKQRSTIKPLEVELTETKVFVCTNISPVSESGTSEQEGFSGFEFKVLASMNREVQTQRTEQFLEPYYRSDGKQWYQGVKSVIKIGIAFREKNAVVIPCTGGWDDLHKYCMNFCLFIRYVA